MQHLGYVQKRDSLSCCRLTLYLELAIVSWRGITLLTEQLQNVPQNFKGAL